MPMGRGLNLWELIELWKQLKRLGPMFRRWPPGGPAAGAGPGSGSPGSGTSPREYRSDQQGRAGTTKDETKS